MPHIAPPPRYSGALAAQRLRQRSRQRARRRRARRTDEYRSGAWDADLAKEIVQDAGPGLDDVSQRVRLTLAGYPAICDLGDDLRDDVVVDCDPGGEQRRAEEFFQRVGDPMEEFEDRQRLRVPRRRAEEQ